MYPVSENFIIQMGKANRYEHLRGTIDGISFNDNNIVSLSYSNRNSDTSDISIGYCYVGQIEASFTGINISRGSWRGKVITLEYGLEYPDESIEWVPIGVFTIVKAEWNDISITVTASDIISRLDAAYSISQTYGTVYDLIMFGCQAIGIQFDRTQNEIENLPNGTEIFGLYPNNDIKTFRDYYGWISQLVGGYFTATRDGKLTLRSWSESDNVDSLGHNDRVIGSVFSDYSTRYAGISVVDIENNETIYISNESGVGSVINLGSNPFLQYGTKETRFQQLQVIADVTEDMNWTPFQISLLNNPIYDLGDLINCTGGTAGSEVISCCIMQIDWTFKQTTALQGFGSDPDLADARSKVDKELSGITSKISENEVIIYSFENSQEFELEDEEEVEVVKIRFATITPKIINLWHEIELDVTADPEGDGVVTCQALFYLNDELISYSPITSWNNDGYHLLHLLYFLKELVSGTAYTWEVHLIIKGGSATIERGDIHASLYGQGLAATDTWDGTIDAEDLISAIFGGSFEVTSLSENVTFETQDIEFINASDSVSAMFGGSFEVTFSESVSVLTDNILFDIYSADYNDQIVSSDGLWFLRSSQ